MMWAYLLSVIVAFAIVIGIMLLVENVDLQLIELESRGSKLVKLGGAVFSGLLAQKYIFRRIRGAENQ